MNELFSRHTVPRHHLVAASAWGGRVLTSVISLCTVRMLTQKLGMEHYAVYALLAGTGGWFMLCDLGVGQSLQNYISEARAERRSYENLIVTSMLIALGLGLAMGIAIWFFASIGARHYLMHSGFLTDADKTRLFGSAAVIFTCSSLGAIVYKIWYGEQRGYLSNLYPALSALLSLVAIWLVDSSGPNDRLFWLVIGGNSAFAMVPLVALLARGVTGYARGGRVVWATVVTLCRRGCRFWAVALVATAVLQIDYLVLSQYGNARDIVLYTIISKMFVIAYFIYSAVLQAFWPTCAEWLALGQWPRVVAFRNRFLLGIAIYIPAFTGGFLWFRSEVVALLMPGAQVQLPVTLLLLAGALTLIRAGTDLFAVILQSMSDIRTLFIWATVQAVTNIVLQITLVPWLGIHGLFLGSAISFVLTVTWALPRRVSYRAAIAPAPVA